MPSLPLGVSTRTPARPPILPTVPSSSEVIRLRTLLREDTPNQSQIDESQKMQKIVGQNTVEPKIAQQSVEQSIIESESQIQLAAESCITIGKSNAERESIGHIAFPLDYVVSSCPKKYAVGSEIDKSSAGLLNYQKFFGIKDSSSQEHEVHISQVRGLHAQPKTYYDIGLEAVVGRLDESVLANFILGSKDGEMWLLSKTPKGIIEKELEINSFQPWRDAEESQPNYIPQKTTPIRPEIEKLVRDKITKRLIHRRYTVEFRSALINSVNFIKKMFPWEESALKILDNGLSKICKRKYFEPYNLKADQPLKILPQKLTLELDWTNDDVDIALSVVVLDLNFSILDVLHIDSLKCYPRRNDTSLSGVRLCDNRNFTMRTRCEEKIFQTLTNLRNQLPGSNEDFCIISKKATMANTDDFEKIIQKNFGTTFSDSLSKESQKRVIQVDLKKMKNCRHIVLVASVISHSGTTCTQAPWFRFDNVLGGTNKHKLGLRCLAHIFGDSQNQEIFKYQLQDLNLTGESQILAHFSKFSFKTDHPPTFSPLSMSVSLQVDPHDLAGEGQIKIVFNKSLLKSYGITNQPYSLPSAFLKAKANYSSTGAEYSASCLSIPTGNRLIVAIDSSSSASFREAMSVSEKTWFDKINKSLVFHSHNIDTIICFDERATIVEAGTINRIGQNPKGKACYESLFHVLIQTLLHDKFERDTSIIIISRTGEVRAPFQINNTMKNDIEMTKLCGHMIEVMSDIIDYAKFLKPCKLVVNDKEIANFLVKGISERQVGGTCWLTTTNVKSVTQKLGTGKLYVGGKAIKVQRILASSADDEFDLGTPTHHLGINYIGGGVFDVEVIAKSSHCFFFRLDYLRRALVDSLLEAAVNLEFAHGLLPQLAARIKKMKLEAETIKFNKEIFRWSAVDRFESFSLNRRGQKEFLHCRNSFVNTCGE
eukprot:UC4_evm5s846